MTISIVNSIVNVVIHENHEERPMFHHRHLHFREVFKRPNPSHRTLRGLTVQFTLEVDEIVEFAVTEADEFGNPTTQGVGTPVLSGFDATLIAGVVNPDNTFTLTPTG